MSSVKGKKSDKKSNKGKDLTKKNSKADSRYNDQLDAESVVQKVEDEAAAVVDEEAKIEAPDAQELVEDVVAPEQVPADDELGINDELVTKQTVGNNLDQMDDKQSFAATVKQNV
jgi:hypothetical protein